MKEIIEEGKPGIAVKYTNHCPVCGCRYYYQQEDVQGNVFSGLCEVYCPSCNNPNLASVLPNQTWLGGLF